MRTAYFVIGPESSGTRLMTKIFRSAGIADPLFGLRRIYNSILVETIKDRLPKNGDIVIWRSMPHERDESRWEPLSLSRDGLKDLGFNVRYIITVRELYSHTRSMVSRNHCSMDDPREAAKAEYRKIFYDVAGNDFIVVSTSLLMVKPERALTSLSEWSGLNLNIPSIRQFIRDEDRKWFKP